MTASGETLAQCLAQCGPGDSILFLDAGVTRILETDGKGGAGDPCPVHYLAADLQARGLLSVARAKGYSSGGAIT